MPDAAVGKIFGIFLDANTTLQSGNLLREVAFVVPV
jgi:hypothetical protein